MTYYTYGSIGPFTNNGSPPVDQVFLNALETFLSHAWFDSAITSNGAGGLTAVTVNYTLGSTTRVSKFSGTGSTTPTFFNHGLGAVPDLVLVQLNGTSATAHSIFADYATLTSTQVKLTSDGSNAFVGYAIKF